MSFETISAALTVETIDLFITFATASAPGSRCRKAMTAEESRTTSVISALVLCLPATILNE